jgi:nucleoside-diphosphate-sugar epimerase
VVNQTDQEKQRMRIFVTGATGWIGAPVVADLLDAGHDVIGLARSDESARRLLDAGAQVHRGSLDDLDALREGAAAANGVIHLAYDHTGDPQTSLETEQQVLKTLGESLTDTGRPLVVASGLAGLPPGKIALESDTPDPDLPGGQRSFAANKTLDLAERGVRPTVVRLPPTVHGEGDRGFVTMLIDLARTRGVSGYIDAGTNHWPAVHRLDAARLFRLAVEQAPAGTVLHAIAETGIPTRDIAETIGHGLDIPVQHLASDAAEKHFGRLALIFGYDVQASSNHTRQLTGWQPEHPDLLNDLQQGHYFTPASP